MPEASDYEGIGMVSPFIGAMGDQLCGFACGSTTQIFSSQIELLNLKFRRAQGGGWMEDDFQLLSAATSKFTKRAHEVFSEYQPP